MIIVDRNEAGTEFNSDGEVVYRLETLVCELQEQTTLSDTYVIKTKQLDTMMLYTVVYKEGRCSTTLTN